MIRTIRTVSLILFLSAATFAASATVPKEPGSQKKDSQAAGEAAPAKSSANERAAKTSDEAGAATRMTPFGQAKTSSAPRAPRRSAASMSHLVKVEEQGDTILFRQRMPFGEKVWKKARTKLSDQERELLEAHQAAKASSSKGPSAGESGRPGSTPGKTGSNR